MKYKLEIIDNKKNIMLFNEDILKLTEIQRNRLNINTIETKLIIKFNDFDQFKQYGESLLISNFNSLKVINENTDIVFEKNNIESEKMSIFSNQTEEEINMHIIFFETLE